MAQKDGEQLPAKKGISLNPEQFNVLNESSGSINTALQAADTDFKLALSQRCPFKPVEEAHECAFSVTAEALA